MKDTKITFKFDIMLFIIFLVLKLDGIIQWKWIWIFAPIWAVWVVQACIALITAIKSFKWKCSITRPIISGPRLVWDAKTNTLYGPNMEVEDNDY